MSNSQKAASEPPDLSAPAPLTRNGYVRPEDVERQVRSAMGMAPAELRARAAIRDERDPEFLKAEALVFLMRRADQLEERALRDGLFARLTERCQAFFRSRIRGFSEDQREDIQQRLLKQLVEVIFHEDDRGDFLQVRFWSALNRRTVDMVEAERKQRRRFDSLDEPISRDAEDAGAALDLVEDRRLGTEDLAKLSEGLSHLDDHLRKVFVMRHALGFAIGKEDSSEEDPADPSLAFHFKVSPRTIRKWLGKAEEQLANYRKA